MLRIVGWLVALPSMLLTSASRPSVAEPGVPHSAGADAGRHHRGPGAAIRGHHRWVPLARAKYRSGVCLSRYRLLLAPGMMTLAAWEPALNPAPRFTALAIWVPPVARAPAGRVGKRRGVCLSVCLSRRDMHRVPHLLTVA
jgi:hypothetical protein